MGSRGQVLRLDLSDAWIRKALEDPEPEACEAGSPFVAGGRLFESKDPKAAVTFPAEVDDEIRRLAGIMAPIETGGVLIGKAFPLPTGEVYFLIERVLPAPPDSVCSPGEFVRGVEGLAGALDAASAEGLDYLGEWHTHDSGDLAPSQVDEETVRAIAASPGYHCRTPILIIAHALEGSGNELTITVYPEGLGAIRLVEVKPPA